MFFMMMFVFYLFNERVYASIVPNLISGFLCSVVGIKYVFFFSFHYRCRFFLNFASFFMERLQTKEVKEYFKQLQ